MPPSIDQKILDYLRRHDEGVTDRDLAAALDLPDKAQASSHCLQLVRAGKVERRAVNGRVRNFARRPGPEGSAAAGAPRDPAAGAGREGEDAADRPAPRGRRRPEGANRPQPRRAAGGPAPRRAAEGEGSAARPAGPQPDRGAPPGGTGAAGPRAETAAPPAQAMPGPAAGAWEPHVRESVVAYLQGHGYTVARGEAAPHGAGRDIEARSGPAVLWVVVKGYPAGSERSHAQIQAQHWFRDALGAIVEWRGADPFVLLAVALPDYPAYRELAARTRWLQPAARFGYFWVQADGSVTADPGLA